MMFGNCPLCKTPITTFVGNVPMMTEVGQQYAHQECMFRMVRGGIGHVEDHSFWCEQMGDPDGGRTYRDSALEVWALHEKGELPL